MICHSVARIDIAYLCIQFDDTFSCTSYTIVAPKICNGSNNLTTPLSGTVCCPQAETEKRQTNRQTSAGENHTLRLLSAWVIMLKCSENEFYVVNMGVNHGGRVDKFPRIWSGEL